jgi:hypothetical protein
MNGLYLFAVDVKPSDYEWQDTVQPAPELETQTVQPSTPTKPIGTTFYCRDADGNLVEAGLYFQRRFDALMVDPAWIADQARRQEERAARNQARLDRIAERQKRKLERKGNPA